MLWRGIGAFAAIAMLGAVMGHVATGNGEPPATRAIHVGAATLTVPAGWHVVNGPGTTLTDGHDRLRVVFGSPADRSLVPPALRAEARGKAPKAARLAGYRAWSYGGVTVLPSARGVLGVACATTTCTRAIRSVSITGAAILTPTPELAVRLRAPALLATLDTARVSARAILAGAPDRQLAAAPLRRLAAAHRATLDGLRPFAGPALISALSQAEQAYSRLADVSSASDYDAARDDVIAADRAVDLAVARLARAGAPGGQRPPPAATPPGGISALVLLLVLAAGLLVSALVPTGIRRLRTSAPGTSSLVASPCLVAQRRRTPIAPPPTYGRWNEAPRGPSAGVADGDARDGVMASSSTA
jgi:hypothetical protein